MSVAKRKTTQFLLPPVVKSTEAGDYNAYPGFQVEENSIHVGYGKLTEYIISAKTVVIDGYAGVFWQDLYEGIKNHCDAKGLKVQFHKVDEALKTNPEIDVLIAPFLGGQDPIFGRRTTLELQDFFVQEQLEDIKPNPEVEINVLYGVGAALCNWNDPLIYVDLPKNELQFRMRAKSIANLGANHALENAKAMYKRFYFVDWVVLNKHKQRLTKDIAVIVDDQRPNQPYWGTGECMRKALTEMGENFFRARPWFEPGPWGGTWMKDHFGQLSQDVPNYAWSFELITPENGLLLEDQGKMLEVSFDFLMYHDHGKVLGRAAQYFGHEFPIRFDYLDTFDGGNLSVQVHPQQDYFVAEFGEKFTQDECYYILDAKDDAQVYLGFKDNINPEEFRDALETSQQHASEMEVERYVHAIEAKKHDLFLIPNGTVHGSGKNNLVLEISATPYIFTFKLYDWLRLDLDGKPRPINIERGFKNLDFSRTEAIIERDFVAKPQVKSEGEGWKILHLPTHEQHFYEVHRYEFEDAIEISTNQDCHVLMLVEGTSILLKTAKGLEQRFSFAETFVVSAACESYTLINEGKMECKVIQAHVDIEKIQF